MLLIMGVTLYTSRVVLNQLGVEDYGIYNVVGGIVVMFSFFNGAMAQSTQRFLSFELGKRNEAKLQQTFSTAMIIHILIGIFIIVLAETVGLWFLNTRMTIPSDRLIASNWVYQCSIAAFVISIVRVPYNAAIIAHEEMQVYAYIGIVEVLLKLFIAFSLSWVTVDKLKIYSILILCVSLLVTMLYRLYCRHCFKECHFKYIYERSLLLSMSRYAAWSIFGSLAWIGKSQGCNIILNLFLGPTINAAYGFANQVNTALNSFVQNFTTAVNPQITKRYASGEYASMYSLVYYGSKTSFFLIFLLSVPLILVTDKILVFWLKSVPDYTVIFTQLVIINSILESFVYNMGTAIQATGRIKWYQIIVGITILLNLPIAFFLLKYGFPPYVIFIASISLSVITLLERLFIMRIVLPDFSIIQFCKNVFVPSFWVSMVVLILLLCIDKLIDISSYNFIVVIVFVLLLVGVIELALGFNKTERTSLFNMVKSRLKKW